MPIFIPQTTTALATARYFSAKATNVRVFSQLQNFEDSDFCTCLTQCIPDLPAFTDEIGDDFYKNDKFALFLNTITDGSIVVTLSKQGSADILLTDNTYGTYSNNVLLNFFRFELDFYKTWLNSGYGVYSFKIQNFNVAGTLVQTLESPKFNLKRFSSKSANKTVRIETQQSGILQHGANYGSSFFAQQVRVRGSLTFTGESIENSSLQLNNSLRSQIQIKDQLLPQYTLTIELAGSKQANFIMLDYLFANIVNVSDYNVYNYVFDPRYPNTNMYRSIPVKRTSTEFNSTRTKLRKTFNIGMEYNNKNVFKINS
jgi:hypothetical protein